MFILKKNVSEIDVSCSLNCLWKKLWELQNLQSDSRSKDCTNWQMMCRSFSPPKMRRCLLQHIDAMQCNAIQCNTMQYVYIYIMQCNAVHQWNKWRFVALLSKYSINWWLCHDLGSALRQFLLSHYLTTKSSVIAGLMQCAPPQQNLHGSSWSFFQRSASA